MSYDFHLFNPSLDRESNTSIKGSGDAESAAINPGPIDPDAEHRKRELAEALIRSNPELEIFQFGFERIAELEGVTVDEARIRYRHLELNGSEDGNGIQITLFDHSVSITVPYWHTGSDAAKVFQEIWMYLRILKSHGKLSVFDPQLDRIINLDTDYDDVVNRYTGVVERIDEG